MESGDFVEIISGLNEGDRVVTSGQFLIDSEASLRASFNRMGGDDGSDGSAETAK
jgi:Cu(I)/Ag(I) efflux system membrane fusion protein